VKYFTQFTIILEKSVDRTSKGCAINALSTDFSRIIIYLQTGFKE